MLSPHEKNVVDVVVERAPLATTLQQLDQIAHVARTTKETWRSCESIIHKRNMRLLGKDGGPAYYRKGSQIFRVDDGWFTGHDGKTARIHARGLSEHGFKYVPQGEPWRSILNG